MAQSPFTNLTQDLVWRNNSSLVHTSDLQRKEKKKQVRLPGTSKFFSWASEKKKMFSGPVSK